MKRILSLLLTLCLLALLCVPALAEETCDHAQTFTNTWLEKDGAILSTSEDGHTMRGTLHEETRCVKCLKILNEKLTPNASMSEPHSFENGTCSVCGYKIACTHPDSFSYICSEDLVLISTSAAGHTVNAVRTEVTCCTVCSAVLSEREIKGVFLEEHDYQNGKCEFCGYVNTCKHEHTETEEYYEPGAMFIASSNETGHTLVGMFYQATTCLDCEMVIEDKKLGNRQKTFAHDFLNGRCIVCNYKQPESTATPDPTATPAPTPTVNPTDVPTEKPTEAPTDAPTQAPTAAPTAKPTAAPGKADVPKTGDRSFTPAMAALMLCAAGALLLARRK